MSEPTATTQTVVVAAPRVAWKDWIPVIALVITICGLFLASGKTLGQVADNTRRIVDLERRADQRDEQLQEVRERMSKMDGKLDLLVERTRGPAQ